MSNLLDFGEVSVGLATLPDFFFFTVALNATMHSAAAGI
jgi:hypothetical protein